MFALALTVSFLVVLLVLLSLAVTLVMVLSVFPLTTFSSTTLVVLLFSFDLRHSKQCNSVRARLDEQGTAQFDLETHRRTTRAWFGPWQSLLVRFVFMLSPRIT